MNIEEFREYCLAKSATTESTPFDQKTLVFKVHGKMFSLTSMDDFASINLKCDPEWAIQLREENEGIQPGFHMNKTHWNTVMTDGSVSDELLLPMLEPLKSLAGIELSLIEEPEMRKGFFDHLDDVMSSDSGLTEDDAESLEEMMQLMMEGDFDALAAHPNLKKLLAVVPAHMRSDIEASLGL